MDHQERSVNTVALMGRLGKDAELKYTPSGKPVVMFSMATNSRYRVGTEWKVTTDWHQVVCFSEKIAPFLVKGCRVYVCGRLGVRMDKDGRKAAVQVVCSELILLGNPRAEDRQHALPVEGAEKPTSSDFGVSDDDVPF